MRPALVSGDRSDVPYNPSVEALYTPAELLTPAQGTTGNALDDRIWSHYKAHGGRSPDAAEARIQRLHDLSIEIARDKWLGDLLERHVVGVMGGHRLKRGTAGYRTAAYLGRALARAGRLVVTGGGPGAMEAANLGAFLADLSEADLEHAIETLKGQPKYDAAHEAEYKRLALDVFDRHKDHAHENLSVPTWHYGFEPTNPFATRIAKYFANSLREDGLLTIALDGVVYLPGRAGTLQEIFQDAAQNYYGSGYAQWPWVSPMVFLPGSEAPEQALVEHAVALVRELAQLAQPGNPLFAEAVGFVSDVDAAVEFITGHPPQRLPPT
jgi:predicted Rossmann-fold nucleotide-binding protein